ncbi:MAG TPA: TonB family protein [Blastocatellia bacterium]|nr:TonB family protein [Blastocatellia bacterium]
MPLNKAEALRQAELFLARGKLASAIAVYQKLVEEDPLDLTSVCALGDIYVKADRSQDAIKDFSRIADKYRDLGLYIKAAYLLRKIHELDQSDPSVSMRLADVYSREGLHDKAHDAFVEAGAIFAQQGRMMEALEANDRALAIDPDSRQAKTAIAVLSGELGAAKHSQPPAPVQNSGAQNIPTQAAAPNGNPDPVEKRSKRVDDGLIIKQISKAELAAGYGDVDQAVAILRDLLARQPDSVEVHTKLKDIYLRYEMVDQASQECLEIARIYAASGDADRAKDFIVRAQRLNRSQKPSIDISLTSAPPLSTVPPLSGPQAPRDSQPMPEVAVSASGDLKLGTVVSQPKVDTGGRLKPPVAPEPLPQVVPPFEEQVTPPSPPPFERPADLDLASPPVNDTTRLVFEESTLARVEEPSPALAHAEAFYEESPKKSKKAVYAVAAGLLIAALGVGAVVGPKMYERKLDNEYRVLVQATEELPTMATPGVGDELMSEQMDVPAADAPAKETETTSQRPEPDRPDKKQLQNDQPVRTVAATPNTNQQTRAQKPSAPAPPMVGMVNSPTGGVDNPVPKGLPGNANTTGPEAPPPPVAASRRTGIVTRGEAIRQVQPVYPEMARTAGQSGSVTVEISVNEKGDVVSARAISGPQLLRDSAVTAAKRWKFKPAMRDGVPITCVGVINFNFKM